MAFFLLSNIAFSVAPAHADAPALPVAIPTHSVTLTAYNAVPGQTDSEPETTASGAYSNPEIVAARSQDLADELPFGTIIEITGPASSGATCGYGAVESLVGYRVIADTMNPRYTERVDILFNTKSNYLMPDGTVKNASTILGICPGASIRVVGHLSVADTAHLPVTQRELAALVKGEAALAAK